ncbi:uncharacterized protein BO87DRAFT_458984 [Aspergillus neoniger CBS 115656]|uniref:LysM domain-containing protein n=1 Tax=Aspergillus neoniger (strain CBS 115656) TaxID=1448310 RepID=A0A318YKJ9_ASPNB|nr:hypothetical protein BO87DRAFT_458984 [Aspergillus neoniger CBS 115656]PYH34634.1 hypothetical protein BO87DRAFT_458984 [Aspergillus neoniger CBS 115656]
MLLNFAIYNPLNDSQTHSTIYACTTANDTATSSVARWTAYADNNTTNTSSVNLELGVWGSVADSAHSQLLGALDDVESYIGSVMETDFVFGYSGKAVVGLYIGGGFYASSTAATVMDQMRTYVASGEVSSQMVLQYCGSTANYIVGLAVNMDGDLPAVQQLMKTWSDAACVSGFDSYTDIESTLNIKSQSSHNTSMATSRSAASGVSSRSDTCSTVQVVSGDSCSSLVTECGITATEFYE